MSSNSRKLRTFPIGTAPKMRPGDRIIALRSPIRESLKSFWKEVERRAVSFRDGDAEEFLQQMQGYIFVGNLVSRDDATFTLENDTGVRESFPLANLFCIRRRWNV